MARTRSFRKNLKNNLKIGLEIRRGIEGSFWNQEPNNIEIYHLIKIYVIF
jgi:hypothetical protein